MAVARYAFFGREVITLRRDPPDRAARDHHGPRAAGDDSSTSCGPLGIEFGLATIIVGHATFCVVVVYNNVLARLRRTAGSLDEASADLGADNWQTFRYVMLPQMRTALLAGGAARVRALVRRGHRDRLHAGADQTLPIWIFASLFRPAELPIVNVVALFVIVVSIIPIYFAQRLAGGTGLTSDRPVKGTVRRRSRPSRRPSQLAAVTPVTDRAGDARAAEAAVAVRVPREVLLVVGLGVVERACRDDLGRDLRRSPAPSSSCWNMLA